MAMAGTVKFFNAERGYGFIKPDDGGRDVFVHVTAVEQAGLKSLNEGQRISFDVESDKKGKEPKAVNLVVAGCSCCAGGLMAAASFLAIRSGHSSRRETHWHRKRRCRSPQPQLKPQLKSDRSTNRYSALRLTLLTIPTSRPPPRVQPA